MSLARHETLTLAATFFVTQNTLEGIIKSLFGGKVRGCFVERGSVFKTLFSISCPIALTVPDAPVPFGLGYLLPFTIIGLNCRGEKKPVYKPDLIFKRKLMFVLHLLPGRRQRERHRRGHGGRVVEVEHPHLGPAPGQAGGRGRRSRDNIGRGGLGLGLAV